MPGYREESGVDPHSTTETFVAAEAAHRQLALGGRAVLPAHRQAAAKRARPRSPSSSRARRTRPFEDATTEELSRTCCSLRIQPDEGVSLAIGAKVPGRACGSAPCTWTSATATASARAPEAYERLLLDAMLGDPTLFTRSDEVGEHLGARGLDHRGWARDRRAFPNYAAGTWGPVGSEELMGHDGREWLRH